MTKQPTQPQPTLLLSGEDIQRTLKRLTHELLEQQADLTQLVLLGILTRGKPLAERVGQLIHTLEGQEVPVGYVDITLYRDDTGSTFRPAGESLVPVDITGKTVVLVDDVLFSGRSVRAALDALNAFGRPARVQLMVLLDRGHRQLPIRPDFVGKNLPTALNEHIQVHLKETDGQDEVVRLAE
ncbi:MAG: bifunctional pyr operon transcriptional regulator/uracil phosphoribosyltransferase PyrR [Candidatus Melainabacteria bacterium]